MMRTASLSGSGPHKSMFYSEVIETELRQRFMTISYRKLKAAQKGGPDPLRRSLQVLKIMHDVKRNNTRLETECSALLYIAIPQEPQPQARPRRNTAPSRMVVVLEQAPPQRIAPAPVPVAVPVEPEPALDIEMEFLEEDDVEIVEEGHDGGSMQRKRKANGVNDAGRCDSKLRICESMDH